MAEYTLNSCPIFWDHLTPQKSGEQIWRPAGETNREKKLLYQVGGMRRAGDMIFFPSTKKEPPFENNIKPNVLSRRRARL